MTGAGVCVDDILGFKVVDVHKIVFISQISQKMNFLDKKYLTVHYEKTTNLKDKSEKVFSIKENFHSFTLR